MTLPNVFPKNGSPLKDREVDATTLPNGVRVITERMPHVRSVSMGVWIGTGSRHEKAEENGISHFIEHMVFKGTKHRSAEEIARSVDSIGGGLDAFTAKEMVSYNTKVLDDHMPIAFDVLSDLVLNPLVPRTGHRKGKRGDSRRAEDGGGQPGISAHRDFFQQLLEGSFHSAGPSSEPRTPSANSTGRCSTNTIARIYEPSNILITAAGNLTHDQMVALAGEKFAESASDWSGSSGSDARAACSPRVPQQDVAGANASLYGRALLCSSARGAVRLLRAQHRAGRRYELAPVPEYPRETGACLCGIFGVEHVPRHRLHGDLRRHVDRNRAASRRV